MTTTLSAPKSMPGVERRAKLSAEEFSREHLMPRRPVVVTDALSHWKALGRWTPEFLREEFPDRLVNVDDVKRPLGPFIDEVLASTAENPAPYLRNEELSAVFPEIAEEIQPLPPYMKSNWLRREFRPPAKILQRIGSPEIYIGGAGRSFPVIHFDWLHTHAFLMQLHGAKQYYVFGPDQTPFMYPVPDDANRSQINNVEYPDVEKFPLFDQAKGYSFTLEPGELLFVPSGWWHTVRILSPSITISVNIANRSNWRQVREDFCTTQGFDPKTRRKVGAYLRLIGARSRLAELFG